MMEKIKKGLDKVLEWSCIGLLAVMTVLVTYQVITRYLFNSPSAISEVLARYLFVWMVLLCSAYLFGRNEHMNIPFIKDKLPARGRLVCEFIAEIMIALFNLGVIVIGGYLGAIPQMSQLDSSLQISIGIIYFVLPISGVCTLFYFVYSMKALVREWSGLKRGEA